MDSGNFSEYKPPHPWEKTTFLYDLMARLGYDAVTPGDRELIPGLDSLRTLAARHPDIHMVSANLKTKSGDYVLPQYAVIKKNGIRFGVTGTTSVDYYQRNVRQTLQQGDDFTFEDSRAALLRVVPELRAKADVVVVLMSEMVDTAAAIASAVPGIDVAVAGHDPGVFQQPEKRGDSMFIRCGSRGQYLYRLPLVLDPGSKRITGHGGRAVLLDDKMAKDVEIDTTATQWERRFKARYVTPIPAAPATVGKK